MVIPQSNLINKGSSSVKKGTNESFKNHSRSLAPRDRALAQGAPPVGQTLLDKISPGLNEVMPN